jgi:pimeloyl-ACP methyl ester carboxylesterase
MPIAELSSIRLNYLQLPANEETATPAEIVLVHGLATNMSFWYAQIAPALTAIGRVTLYDLRGHGYSEMPAHGYSPAVMADDLRRLLDHLSLQRVHLVAHSFGGSVAIALAYAQPDRVATMTLADVRLRAVQNTLALAAWPHWPKLRGRLGRVGIEIDERDPESGLRLLTELARLRVEHPERAEFLQKTIFGFDGNLMGRRSAMRWLRLLDETSARADLLDEGPVGLPVLQSLRAPVLAVFGEKSISIASARALKRHVPDCTLRIVPGAGHFFPLTRPATLVRPLLRFLAAKSGAPPSRSRSRRGRGAAAPKVASARAAGGFLGQPLSKPRAGKRARLE